MQNEKINVLKGVAEDMRHDILEMCHNCGRQNGHLGGCMSSVEILAVLYTEIMNLVEANQGRIPWDDRDRFIMSKGHAGIAMYAALKQVGVLPQSVIDGKIRGENSIIYRHPKMNTDYAIECSVGSLGMGLGYGIGLCEALNRKLSDAKVYVMLGDGECNEGSIWESAAYAGAHGLDKLTVIVDKNKLQLDGYTSQILSMDNLENKWRAFGFKTIEIDGHNFEDIHNAFRIEHTGKPLAIIANTTKGKGCSFAENLVDWHDNWLTDDLYKQAKNEIGDTLLRNKALQIAEYRYNARDPQYSRHENADGSGYLDYSEDNIAQWNSLDSKHVLGSIFEKFANQDKKFLLLFADCANRINIKEMLIKYPDQCLEMGIAEQNMITVASALANEGFHVFAVAYAPFITARVLDQIRVNLGYMCAPVKLVGLSAGLASSDLGATHTAFEDIANMRSIPNMLIESPAINWKL